MLWNSISYSIAYNFKEKNGFGIDKACDSILMWHGDIVFKRESLFSDGRLLQRVKRFLIRNSTPLTWGVDMGKYFQSSE